MRDVAVAFLVALVVLATRGYRLDEPRDMYFDEVYHARTAFELLAEREPYEWTHPHLAKEIMALGILALGGDRVVGTEPADPATRAFAVASDGTRVFVSADAMIVRARDGSEISRTKLLNTEPVRAVGFHDDEVVLLTEHTLARYTRAGALRDDRVSLPTALGSVNGFSVAG